MTLQCDCASGGQASCLSRPARRELEFADEVTMTKSLENRREM